MNISFHGHPRAVDADFSLLRNSLYLSLDESQVAWCIFFATQ